MEQSSPRYRQVFFSSNRGPGSSGRLDLALKRIFDILAAAAGLIVLAPLFAYLAWRIRRDSPGPVFYRGARMGRGGKAFQILKFRTMYERPESYAGPRVTAGGDERITPIGKTLRDTKLNELPQLWNVLKGEMSLVGPRPEDPEIAAKWPEGMREEILSVRPGITSPASVMYRDEESMLSARPVMETYLREITPSKLRLDQLYVRYRSMLGDLDVLFWTALAVAPLVRKQTPEEGRLFLGPLYILGQRHLSWFGVDTVITCAAMATTGVLWRMMGPLNVGLPAAMALTVGFALLFSLVNAARGVNRIEWSRSAAADVQELLPGAMLATLIAMGMNYAYPDWIAELFYGPAIPEWVTRPLLPTPMLVMAAALALMGFVAARYRSRLVTGMATRWVSRRRAAAQTAKERVLIVGAGEGGRYAAWMLAQGNYAGTFRVVGFVDDDFYMKDRRIYGTEVLGRREQIAEIVRQQDVGIILFAIHRITRRERHRLLEICKSTPARVVVVPDIHAALDGLARHPEAAAADNDERLPCQLCLSKVTPLKVDAWLKAIEATAREGDLEQVRAQVRGYRESLRGDVETQEEANGAD